MRAVGGGGGDDVSLFIQEVVEGDLLTIPGSRVLNYLAKAGAVGQKLGDGGIVGDTSGGHGEDDDVTLPGDELLRATKILYRHSLLRD